ncbi:thioredoxin family protein [Candidatus Saccharibacteria bacterium]|nr:thioredoxin family protein [Candidatus Saccharibacteria bacterium]
MKRLIIIVASVLSISLGIIFIVSRSSKNDVATNNNSTTIPHDDVIETEAESKENSANYIDYSEQAVADTKGEKILFFHAEWCPKCRALDKDIKEQGLPENVTVFKVDYDSNQELRKKHGVTIQTTVVKIDDNGDTLIKLVVYDNPTIDNVLLNL